MINEIFILGCPQPYSFQHQMSLSPDALEFQQKVAKAPISGNIDNPEGGFDALVQVLALCNFHLVCDIKPPNHESCFPQFFPRICLILSS